MLEEKGGELSAGISSNISRRAHTNLRNYVFCSIKDRKQMNSMLLLGFLWHNYFAK